MLKLGVEVHTCDPRTRMPETGESLQVWSQPDQHRWVPGLWQGCTVITLPPTKQPKPNSIKPNGKYKLRAYPRFISMERYFGSFCWCQHSQRGQALLQPWPCLFIQAERTMKSALGDKSLSAENKTVKPIARNISCLITRSQARGFRYIIWRGGLARGGNESFKTLNVKEIITEVQPIQASAFMSIPDSLQIKLLLPVSSIQPALRKCVWEPQMVKMQKERKGGGHWPRYCLFVQCS